MINSKFPFASFGQIEQIQLGASVEINITVQIDHERTLSVGRHFLTIPAFVMYEQLVVNGAVRMFVSSVESVTVNFTVREGTKSVDIIFIISDPSQSSIMIV